jgi:hypothetical protein
VSEVSESSDMPPNPTTHVDQTGAPCAHHTPIALDALLQLALVGSRAAGFHHDCASKLQGILMALEEIGELAVPGDADLQRAIESATEASRELNALLSTSRALTKPPVRGPIGLGELVGRAAARVAVTLRGALPDATVTVSVPAATQALALTIDVAAGAGRGRALEVAGRLRDGAAELVVPLAAPSTGREALAIASFAIVRDGGRLWCASAGDRLWIHLPTR